MGCCWEQSWCRLNLLMPEGMEVPACDPCNWRVTLPDAARARVPGRALLEIGADLACHLRTALAASLGAREPAAARRHGACLVRAGAAPVAAAALRLDMAFLVRRVCACTGVQGWLLPAVRTCGSQSAALAASQRGAVDDFRLSECSAPFCGAPGASSPSPERARKIELAPGVRIMPLPGLPPCCDETCIEPAGPRARWPSFPTPTSARNSSISGRLARHRPVRTIRCLITIE